jgi:hypothetical protein
MQPGQAASERISVIVIARLCHLGYGQPADYVTLRGP